MVQINNEQGWKLQSLTIEFQDWGEHVGKYLGRIKFKNSIKETFDFNIPPEKMEKYLNLIKDEVTESAARLGERILQSMRELPTSEQKQIGEEIAHESVTS
jgi:hypothetical protein